MSASESMSFGELLRQHRLAAGLTQESLAEKAGVSARSITVLERGVVRAPRRDTLEMLADALELEPDERQQWRELRRQLSVRQAEGDERRRASAGVPVPANELIGRDQDIDELIATLQDPDVRLLTITGPGGVGKSRVAIELGRRLEPDQFTDGIVFLELSSIQDPELVVPTIAKRLGLQGGQRDEMTRRLAAYLSDRWILLILDNFEHVLSAAPHLPQLLPERGRSRVVVTSRARLQLQHEHLFSLQVLGLPSRSEMLPLEVIANYPAVRLFSDRARRANPEFQLTQQNASEVQAICAHLDGLPLAIELAAARTRVLSPRLMLPRLRHRLGFLTSGFQDTPDRHRTMRSAIAWSYESLGPPEQFLFDYLTVFVGGWTFEAAEAISPDEVDPISGLESLLNNSLITRSVQSDGTVRFGMLETLRAFGQERLHETGNRDLAQRAHARYILMFVEDAEPELRAGDQEYWLGLVGAELPNIREALNWTLHSGDSPDTSARLAGALSWFWFNRGLVSEGRQWLTSALVKARERTRPRMKALAAAGWLAHLQQESDDARALLEESLSISRELSDDWYTAWTLHLLGRVAYFNDDAGAARTFAWESLRFAESAEDDWLLAWPYHLLGLAAHIDRDFETARWQYERSLAMRQQLDDRAGIATLLALLGLIALREGNARSALDHFHESLALYRRLEGHWFAANLVADVVGVASLLGEPERAARLCGYVEETRRFVGAELIPLTESVYQEGWSAVRNALSSEQFEVECDAGKHMTLDEAVDEALQVGSGHSSSESAL